MLIAADLHLLYLFVLVLTGFLSSYAVVAAIRKWALRRNLLDIPNERSSHTVPTPRGGGLAIALITLIGFAFTHLWLHDLALAPFLGYMLAGIIILAISGADDILEISPKVRLLFQLLAAIIFVGLAGFATRVYLPFVGELDWRLLGIPITVIWLVGLTNAYNFMDGIDGLAAGQAIVAGGFWLAVALLLGASDLAGLAALLVGSSLGFLLHNTPPARIFMGDVGSTVLGYTFATIPILAFGQTGNPRMPILGLLCIAPFAFDAGLTVVRRTLNREDILRPHRTHLYQRLVGSGRNHAQVTCLYVAIAFSSSLMGIIYLRGDDLASLAALTVVALLMVGVALGTAQVEHLAIKKRCELTSPSTSPGLMMQNVGRAKDSALPHSREPQ